MGKVWLVVLLFLSLVACGVGPGARPIGAELQETCSEPRAQVCTRQYDPVCAFLGKSETREYGNACTACADAQVSGFIAGSCPQ
jgi:hypothetical protein